VVGEHGKRRTPCERQPAFSSHVVAEYLYFPSSSQLILPYTAVPVSWVPGVHVLRGTQADVKRGYMVTTNPDVSKPNASRIPFNIHDPSD